MFHPIIDANASLEILEVCLLQERLPLIVTFWFFATDSVAIHSSEIFLGTAYSCLHNFLSSNQFLSKLIDIFLITYKS